VIVLRRTIVIEILDAKTGLRSKYKDSYDKDDGWYDFIWTEGNYSCDCNRSLFFARGRLEDDPKSPPCGSDRYFVKIVDEGDGTVLLDESPLLS
jgi:hypothetical protein